MVKKSLQAWYNSGDISSNQKEIISKFGVNDYSPEYALLDLKKLWYYDEIFERNKNSYKLEISGKILKMVFFSTCWNNNLIIVISEKHGSVNVYDVWLLVYEIPSRQIEELLETFRIFNGYYVLSSAEQSARELESTLKSDNPVSYNYLPWIQVEYENYYNSDRYPFILKNGQVKRIDLTSNFYSVKNNPDAYIKPLDIVKISMWDSNKNKDMVHACIYLGNKQVCHVFAERRSGNRKDQVKIENWEEFFKVLPTANKIFRYHPVIAFKKPEKIIEHIAKCIEGKERYFAVKNKIAIVDEMYRRANNCEHFVNRCVLGLNFSELVERRNGSKSWLIVPTVSFPENSRALDNLTSYPTNTINDIKSYKVHHPQGIPMEERIEVQPKSWYKLSKF